MADQIEHFRVGQRVIVTQQITRRDEVWTTQVQGTAERYEQSKTGAWYAHAKDDKLWLDRLTLRKQDGEIVICVLDDNTRVEVLPQELLTPSETDVPAEEDEDDEQGSDS